MCDPVSATVLAVSAAGLGAYGADRSAKNAQKSAVEDLQGQYAALAQQQVQVNAQATDEATERAKQAVRDMGRMEAAFSDSGLTGNSQQRLMVEQAIQANTDQSTIERNRENKIAQTKQDAFAAQAGAKRIVNQNPRQSPIGIGLQIASAGMNAYGSSGGFKKTG